MGKVQSNTTKKVINLCRRGVKASPTWDTQKQMEQKAKLHNIMCIEQNGDIKWVASYDGKFAAYYAMQLWWCSKHKCNFFCKQNLKKASEHIKISKSMRSVMFDYGDVTYILSTPKGRTIMIGLGGCPKYEYNIKTMI